MKKSDFDRGFGIGGLERYTEPPTILTREQLKKLEQMEASDQRCHKCGASKNFDGAMFTTLGGSGICDDCA